VSSQRHALAFRLQQDLPGVIGTNFGCGGRSVRRLHREPADAEPG
jgi:hypothetical protein